MGPRALLPARAPWVVGLHILCGGRGRRTAVMCGFWHCRGWKQNCPFDIRHGSNGGEGVQKEKLCRVSFFKWAEPSHFDSLLLPLYPTDLCHS